VTIPSRKVGDARMRGAGVREGHQPPIRQLGDATGAAGVGTTLTGDPVERLATQPTTRWNLLPRKLERAHHTYLGTEHLVLGLLQQNGLARSALKAMGIEIEVVRATIESLLGRDDRSIIGQIVPTSGVRRVFRTAVDDAIKTESPNGNAGHLLMALLTEGSGSQRTRSGTLGSLRSVPERKPTDCAKVAWRSLRVRRLRFTGIGAWSF
jgi:hypothetical protein